MKLADSLPAPRCCATLFAALFAFAPAAALRAATPQDAPWTLADIVRAAVANSRSVRIAALGRESDRVALWAAQDRYRPDLLLASALGLSEDRERDDDGPWAIERDKDAELAASIVVRVPTGGRFVYGFVAESLEREQETEPAPATSDEGHAQSHELRFVQPLLRGAGPAIDTIPLVLAKLDDQISELDFSARLTRVISQAIVGFRALARTEREAEIARLSLERAVQLVDTNRALIEAGRMAPLDLVQSEVEVANKEVSLLAAENRLESARLALFDVLDVPRETEFATKGSPPLDSVALDRDQLLATAFERNPGLGILVLQFEQARLRQRQAENDRFWNLDLVTAWNDGMAHGRGGTIDTDLGGYSARLVLGRAFGDRDRDRRIAQSRIATERSRLRLVEGRETLALDLDDRLRSLAILRRQVDLARTARELAERQLEVEGEKLRVGRSSNFQYLAYENDLVVARLRELAAVVAWLDGLTLLDEAVGTTLDTWGVSLGEASRTETPPAELTAARSAEAKR